MVIYFESVCIYGGGFLQLKKLLLFLSIIMMFVLAACSNDGADDASGNVEVDEESLNETGFPILNETETFEFFAGQAPATNEDWNEALLFETYEEMTNMEINWEMVPHSSLVEKRNLALGSGSLPDVFHSASMPIADIIRYGEQGTFVPLNDLIEKYAPNFKQLLEEYPEIEKSLTMPDGNIYSFPQMADPEFIAYRMGPKPYVNGEWLEALGMDIPETTDDYYEYLKAVKEEDPNGNGEADEVPFGGVGIGTLYDFLRGSFGVANMGSSNNNLDLDPDTGDLRFYPISDGYRQLLEYMNKLYSEELIAQNIFSIESDQWHANTMAGIYGSLSWYTPVDIFGEEAGGAFTPIPALEGPEGHKQFTTLYDATVNPGAFVITSANENPAATVRWIDHFYGEEGINLFFMGVEGETYEVNEDGEKVYMDHITNSPEGLTFEQEIAKYLTFPGGGFPSVITQELFPGAASTEQNLEAAEVLKPNLVEEPWTAFKHTNEENNQLQGFGVDIEKYVTEMRDKFVAGEESFDNWDKYVETIESMGLDDYMEIKNAAYDRYLEN